MASNTPIARNAMIAGCWTGVQAVKRAGSRCVVRNLRLWTGNDCARKTTAITCTPSRTQRSKPAGVSVLAEPPRAEAHIAAAAAAAAGAAGTSAALAPADKLSWRMPPLSELPTPVIRGARRIGLLGLRGYLAIAMVMVVVKIVETALGH